LKKLSSTDSMRGQADDVTSVGKSTVYDDVASGHGIDKK
jgi:hypothetical protein